MTTHTAAVRETTFAFCRTFRGTEAEAARYFMDNQVEAVEHQVEVISNIAESAFLIWTSAKRLKHLARPSSCALS
jgi:hypothetical protein